MVDNTTLTDGKYGGEGALRLIGSWPYIAQVLASLQIDWDRTVLEVTVRDRLQSRSTHVEDEA